MGEEGFCLILCFSVVSYSCSECEHNLVFSKALTSTSDTDGTLAEREAASGVGRVSVSPCL